jgi:hypothetical protein
MKIFYIVEPEVAGGFGDLTVIDRSSGEMVVKELHYKFEGWFGDHLLESAPCYIVSEELADEIKSEQLLGVEFDKVDVSKSDQFCELYPDRELPKFIWLKVTGIPGHDDFGVASGLRLVVSEHALDLLKRIGISHAASILRF